MSRNVPARIPGTAISTAAVRGVQYVERPLPPGALLVYDPRELARQRHEREVAYARWLKRREEIAAADRKTRRFFLGFGAVVGLAVLAVLAGLGWYAYHALSGTAGIGLLALPLAAVVLVGAAGVGHRCITVIQHWHE
jgi:hypothetical protein